MRLCVAICTRGQTLAHCPRTTLNVCGGAGGGLKVCASSWTKTGQQMSPAPMTRPLQSLPQALHVPYRVSSLPMVLHISSGPQERDGLVLQPLLTNAPHLPPPLCQSSECTSGAHAVYRVTHAKERAMGGRSVSGHGTVPDNCLAYARIP